MNDARRGALDFEIVVNAFDVMGRYLRDQCGLVGEIAGMAATGSQAFFSTHGVCPRGEAPGLRVFLPSPNICAP